METRMKHSLELLDVVELAEEREGYAAGTVGAVIELFPDEALVEIVDEKGTTTDLLHVPLEALRPQPSAPDKRIPDDDLSEARVAPKPHVKRHLEKRGVNHEDIPEEVLAVLNDLTEDELKALRRIGERAEAANLDTRLLVAIL